MRVISKLAQIDFQFGDVIRDGDLLVIESRNDSRMQSTVYISPQDIVEFLKRLLVSPAAILFVLALPFFLIRWRRSHKKFTHGKQRVREWPKV